MFKISSFCTNTRLNMFAPLVNKCVASLMTLCQNSCDRLRKILNKNDVLIMNINYVLESSLNY